MQLAVSAIFIFLFTCAALAIPTSSDTPFTGGILSVSAAPPVTTISTLNTGNCNRAGPVNQTGSYLFVDNDIVPPTSYFVPCSSFLSKYGLYTSPKTTQSVSTQVNPYPSFVNCASLALHNQSLIGSTVVNTYSGTSFIEETQACTVWAASSKSFADSPLGTIAAMYSACQYQAVHNDVDKDPLFTGVTGNVVAQVYPGSLLGSDYSAYRRSASFPLPYSSGNPSGGVVTTMPCASFQAAYMPQYKSIESTYDNWKNSVISFWRSPQCTAMVKASNVSRTPMDKRQIEFQSYNGELGVPFGPSHAHHQVGVGGNMADCCGPCQVIAQTLSMLYWPRGSTTPVCSDGPVTSLATSLATLPPASNLVARRLSSANGSSALNASSKYAIVDGSTLKSPSAYMVFQGSVWVSDLCGTLGSALTSLTIAVDPRSVSSIEWNTEQGWGDYINKPFDFEACPTFGWSDPFTTSEENSFVKGGYDYFLTSTIGPPYHPIVSPIPELYVAQPAYSQCSAWRSVGYRAEPFYGAYDPPRVLEAVSAMVAPTSSAVPLDPKVTSTATPQQTASVELPKNTAPPSDPALPDFNPQPSSQAGVDGSKQSDTPNEMASESANTGGAFLDPTKTLSSKPKSGPSSNSHRVQSDAPKADPQNDGGQSDSPLADGKPMDPKTTAQGSNTQSDHASMHHGSPTIPAAVPIESLALPSMGGQKIQTAANGGIVAAGSSIAAGSQAIVQGVTVSNAQDSAVLIDGTSYARPGIESSRDPVKAAVMTLDSSTFTVDKASHLVIEGQTLKQGKAITLHSTPISYITGGGNVVVGSVTQELSAPPTGNAHNPVMTFAGSTYTAGSSSRFVIDGQTLAPGDAIIFQSTPISYMTGGGNIVVGGVTQELSATPIGNGQKTIITFAGSTYTASSSSRFVIDGQTLGPGGAITVQSTPISYLSGGSELVIGTSTQTMLTTAVPVAEHPVITFAGSTYSEQSSAFVIHGQTISKGSAITVQSTPISYGSDGSELMIGTSTQRIQTTAAPPTEHSVITFAGSTYTEESSAFVIHGQTLSKGSAITVSGTPISFAAAGTDVVVASSTQGVNLGSYIMGGFRTGSSTEDGGRNNASRTLAPFTGNQLRLDFDLRLLYCSAAFAIAVSMLAIFA